VVRLSPESPTQHHPTKIMFAIFRHLFQMWPFRKRLPLTALGDFPFDKSPFGLGKSFAITEELNPEPKEDPRLQDLRDFQNSVIDEKTLNSRIDAEYKK
jgi:hypothetical protein